MCVLEGSFVFISLPTSSQFLSYVYFVVCSTTLKFCRLLKNHFFSFSPQCLYPDGKHCQCLGHIEFDVCKLVLDLLWFDLKFYSFVTMFSKDSDVLSQCFQNATPFVSLIVFYHVINILVFCHNVCLQSFFPTHTRLQTLQFLSFWERR